MAEIWLEIEEAPMYLVSSLGRVQNRLTEHILKPWLQSGYPTVELALGCYPNLTRLVHRLVAETFLDGDHRNLEVNHIDGNKTNNCIWNLEWVTRSENTFHAYRTGLNKKRNRVRIVETGVIYESQNDCARAIGGYQSIISQCLLGHRKQYMGLTFQYVED